MSNSDAMRSRYIFIEGEYDIYTDLYRQHEHTILANKIAIKECISLVGIGTVGKSHFIKGFTDNVDTYIQQYGMRSGSVAIISIDPNAILHPTAMGSDENAAAWAGFELIASTLVNGLSERPEIATEVVSAYKEITSDHAVDRIMAFRHLQDAIGKILNGLGVQRLVLIFDEFEQIVEKMPVSFFINLRALRDQYRYQLLYMTVSRKEIYNIGQDNSAIADKLNQAQSFFELFKEPVYLRAVHVEGDCIELVRSLNGRVRLGHRLEWPDYDLILSIVGGHGGLLRTVLMIFDRIIFYRPDGRQQLLHYLMNEPEIQRECEVFLESCTQREITILQAVADIEKPISSGDHVQHTKRWVIDNYAEITALFHKRLLNVISETEFQVVPRIFGLYLQSHGGMQHKGRKSYPPANPRTDGSEQLPPPPSNMPR